MTLTRIPGRTCSAVMPGRSFSSTFFSAGAFSTVLALPLCLPVSPCSSLATSRAAGCKARESFRANLVHKSFLSPLPKYARLPLLSFLMAMLALCQIPKLSAGFGIDYHLAGIFQGVPAPLGQGPHLARKRFLGHL